MAAIETPPSPPEKPIEPKFDRLRTRYESHSPHELLDVIDSLEGERLSARVREAIWVSLIFHLFVFWWIFYGPKLKIFRPATVVNTMPADTGKSTRKCVSGHASGPGEEAAKAHQHYFRSESHRADQDTRRPIKKRLRNCRRCAVQADLRRHRSRSKGHNNRSSQPLGRSNHRRSESRPAPPTPPANRPHAAASIRA